jgi:hypothetical protein
MGSVLMLLNFSGLQRLYDTSGDTFLVDGTQSGSRHLQGHPLARFGHIEFLQLQIRIEPALGLLIGEGNAVSYDGLLSGKVTNLGHD